VPGWTLKSPPVNGPFGFRKICPTADAFTILPFEALTVFPNPAIGSMIPTPKKFRQSRFRLEFITMLFGVWMMFAKAVVFIGFIVAIDYRRPIALKSSSQRQG
jgi:hypothetical protein